MNTVPNRSVRPLASGPKHIVDLQVRPGYAFPVSPLETRVLGGGYRLRMAELREHEDARQWGDDGREA